MPASPNVRVDVPSLRYYARSLISIRMTPDNRYHPRRGDSRGCGDCAYSASGPLQSTSTCSPALVTHSSNDAHRAHSRHGRHVQLSSYSQLLDPIFARHYSCTCTPQFSICSRFRLFLSEPRDDLCYLTVNLRTVHLAEVYHIQTCYCTAHSDLLRMVRGGTYSRPF